MVALTLAPLDPCPIVHGPPLQLVALSATHDAGGNVVATIVATAHETDVASRLVLLADPADRAAYAHEVEDETMGEVEAGYVVSRLLSLLPLCEAGIRRALATPHNSAAPHSGQGRGNVAPSSAKPWRETLRPLAEVLNETVPDTSFLVEGLIPKGWAGMLAGDSKVGKTLLLLELARAVATGGDFLGRPAIQGPVILVLVDDPPALSRQRLRMLEECADNVYVYIERWRPELVETVRAAVAELRPALVIVDTLVKVISGGRDGAENDATTMDRILEGFCSLCVNEQTTVLLIHHVTKQGTLRGSTAIDGALPFILRLARLEDEEASPHERLVRLSLDWKLEPIEPMILQYQDGSFHYRGTAHERKVASAADAVLAALELTPLGATQIELGRELKKRDAEMRDTLRALAEAGKAHSVTDGGRGRPKILWRPGPLPGSHTDPFGMREAVPPPPIPIRQNVVAQERDPWDEEVDHQ